MLENFEAFAKATDAARSRATRLRAAIALAAIGSATIAITSAMASNPVEPPPVAAPAPVPQYYGAADMPAEQPVADDSGAKRFTGRIGDNLTLAMQAAGVPDARGREYVAVLARAIPLADGLSVEDKFDIVVERNEDGSLGQLLYVGLDRVGRADVALLKWIEGKQVVWINADGVGGEAQAGMARPVSGRLTSGFGSRFHPILGAARMHKGIDLAAASGTPIVAAADGRIVAAGWAGGYGRQVAIAHGDGLQTTYSHMSRIAAASGTAVRRGDVIGYVGSSGLSTGPHLHYEVYRNGRPVNPLDVKFASGSAELQGEKLRQFQDGLRQLLVLPGQG
ncbi:M23 family metallopeptidase [Sphingomonas lutea]|uniref:M23 family metallopeptidase n=1 Tax=Sphingomonas lutea TaxID=1045317 RepID=A0A7G9SJA0_9SPHN|nr:M23 family metallopeptidase [Sphingomonas lutea]QNN67925.1 M23 family metallopeptidase [Sphingomonas lutea]